MATTNALQQIKTQTPPNIDAKIIKTKRGEAHGTRVFDFDLSTPSIPKKKKKIKKKKN
jgi:hypothetical protein